MKILIAAAATAASLATLSVPVSAKEVRFEVEYADLNLATAKGQETLDRRIVNAARKACGYGRTQTGSRIRSQKAERCVEDMTAQARKQFASLSGSTAKGG